MTPIPKLNCTNTISGRRLPGAYAYTCANARPAKLHLYHLISELGIIELDQNPIKVLMGLVYDV